MTSVLAATQDQGTPAALDLFSTQAGLNRASKLEKAARQELGCWQLGPNWETGAGRN